MIIDIHTHTFPAKIAADALEKLSRASHTVPFTDGTEDGLSASMKAAGVDFSAVMPVATAARQVPRINDFAAQLNQQTGETGILSFGCMHPDYEDWREELSRVAELGLKGIKIHPVYQGVDLDDPRYLRILERAGELGLIVLTHTGIDIGFPAENRCSPKMALRALQQVGPVTLILAHMAGWRQWEEAKELLAGTTAYLDTSFSTGALSPLDDGFYSPEDLALLNQEQFLGMVRAFGAERILFGTDSPWSGQQESLDWIRALPLTEAGRDAILGGNAQRLLGLESP